jgi:hypothetical protein
VLAEHWATTGSAMHHNRCAKARARKNYFVTPPREVLQQKAVKVGGLEVNSLGLAANDGRFRIRVSTDYATHRSGTAASAKTLFGIGVPLFLWCIGIATPTATSATKCLVAL